MLTVKTSNLYSITLAIMFSVLSSVASAAEPQTEIDDIFDQRGLGTAVISDDDLSELRGQGFQGTVTTDLAVILWDELDEHNRQGKLSSQPSGFDSITVSVGVSQP